MIHKTMISMLFWLIGLYIAYCALLFLMQRQMIFPAGFAGTGPGSPRLPGLEVVWLSPTGARVEAWYLPPAQKHPEHRSPAVIFAHGNAELIDGCAAEFLPVTHMGAGLLLVEYPGYGRSEGSPSQKTIDTVYQAAWDWLAARPDIDPSRIVLAGRSLGGGVVCQLAAKRPSAALILISTFTSARAFARRYLVPGFLVRDPFDNLTVLRSYDRPVLVFHGRRDDIIPYAHGIAVADAAPRARLVSWECSHNDCPPDYSAFVQEIRRFLHDAGLLAPRR